MNEVAWTLNGPQKFEPSPDVLLDLLGKWDKRYACGVWSPWDWPNAGSWLAVCHGEPGLSFERPFEEEHADRFKADFEGGLVLETSAVGECQFLSKEQKRTRVPEDAASRKKC